MRIFNGKNVQLDLPLGSQRIVIAPKSVSGDIMPSNEFLSLLVTSYDYSEIALIVAGPYEINMCADVSGSVGFVCQSLEEAIARFTPKCDCQKEVKAEEKPCECKEECTCCSNEAELEVVEPEVEPVKEETGKPAAKGKSKSKK